MKSGNRKGYHATVIILKSKSLIHAFFIRTGGSKFGKENNSKTIDLLFYNNGKIRINSASSRIFLVLIKEEACIRRVQTETKKYVL